MSPLTMRNVSASSSGSARRGPPADPSDRLFPGVRGPQTEVRAVADDRVIVAGRWCRLSTTSRTP